MIICYSVVISVVLCLVKLDTFTESVTAFKIPLKKAICLKVTAAASKLAILSNVCF